MDRQDTANPAAIYNACAVEHGWPAVCDATLAFEDPALGGLLAIWRLAAAEGRIPARRELTARLLKEHLPYITIYERLPGAQPVYRVRLMGSVFAQIYGDLTGKIIDEAVPKEMVPRFHMAIDQVLAARAPLRFVARVGMNSKDYLVAEYLMAPLTGDSGEPTMVFSRGVFRGDIPQSQIARVLSAR